MVGFFSMPALKQHHAGIANLFLEFGALLAVQWAGDCRKEFRR
jgi:hypothetical protein